MSELLKRDQRRHEPHAFTRYTHPDQLFGLALAHDPVGVGTRDHPLSEPVVEAQLEALIDPISIVDHIPGEGQTERQLERPLQPIADQSCHERVLRVDDVHGEPLANAPGNPVRVPDVLGFPAGPGRVNENVLAQPHGTVGGHSGMAHHEVVRVEDRCVMHGSVDSIAFPISPGDDCPIEADAENVHHDGDAIRPSRCAQPPTA